MLYDMTISYVVGLRVFYVVIDFGFKYWFSRVVKKSMVVFSHFHLSISSSCSRLGILWCSTFTCWHTKHLDTNWAISFIPCHQKYFFKSWYIFSLQDALNTSNYELLQVFVDELLIWPHKVYFQKSKRSINMDIYICPLSSFHFTLKLLQL